MVQAVTDLKKRGFNIDFELDKDGRLSNIRDHLSLQPEDCKIVEYHRFEGQSNPDDSSIIYAIKSNSGLKGTIVDAYGADSSVKLGNFLNKIS